jgi:hypothetical protein
LGGYFGDAEAWPTFATSIIAEAPPPAYLRRSSDPPPPAEPQA